MTSREQPTNETIDAKLDLDEYVYRLVKMYVEDQEFDKDYVREQFVEYSSHVNAALMEKLKYWECQIRPHEELLQAFADNIHQQYVTFVSEGGSYKHRMDVIKSSLMTFAKASIIRAEKAESRISELERERDEAIKEVGKVSREAGTLESQLSTTQEALRKLIYAAKEACVYMGESTGTLELLMSLQEAERVLPPPTKLDG